MSVNPLAHSYKPVAKVTSAETAAPILRHVTGVSGKRYMDLTLLAEGGLGWVFRANQRTGEEVVVKLAKPHHERILLRELGMNQFAPSARGGYAELIDWGVTREGQPFLVFQHVAGRTLEQTRFDTLADVLALLGEVGEELLPLHAIGFVHGDLTPHNLLIRPDGSPVLIDLGLGTRWGEPRRGGTDGYVAPEERVDSRSDVYALGIMLRELLRQLPRAERQRWQSLPAAKAFLRSCTSRRREKRGNGIGDFCTRLLKLRESLCGAAISAVCPSDSPSADEGDAERAFREFSRLAGGLPEYECPTDNPAVDPAHAQALLRMSLHDAGRAAELPSRSSLFRGRSAPDRRLVSNFCNNYARHLLARGRTAEAAHFGGLALDTWEEVAQETAADQGEFARRLNDLGRMFNLVQQPVRSIRCLIRSCAIRMKWEPADSPLLARAWNDLANYLRHGIHQPTAAMLLEAKRYWRKAFGADCNDVACINNDLGRILKEIGNLSAAEFITIRSIQAQHKWVDECHPQMATALLNRGEQLSDERDYQKSEEYLILSTNIREAWFGRSARRTLEVIDARVKNCLDAREFEQGYRLLKDYEVDNSYFGSDPLHQRLSQRLLTCCQKLRRKAEARRTEVVCRAQQELFGNVERRTVPCQWVVAHPQQWLKHEMGVKVIGAVKRFFREDEQHLLSGKDLMPADLLEC